MRLCLFSFIHLDDLCVSHSNIFFRDNPDAVRFHVVFKTRYSPTLVDIVRRTLEGSRPHFNVSESRYVVYEIMPVGGLVFILRNLSVTPETTTLPTTTEVVTSPPTTTSTVPPSMYP